MLQVNLIPQHSQLQNKPDATQKSVRIFLQTVTVMSSPLLSKLSRLPQHHHPQDAPRPSAINVSPAAKQIMTSTADVIILKDASKPLASDVMPAAKKAKPSTADVHGLKSNDARITIVNPDRRKD